MQFIQCDDLVEPAVAEEIERVTLSKAFPWFFYSNVNSTVRPEDRPGHTTVIYDPATYGESFGFSHLLFPTEDAASPWLTHPKVLLETFLNRHRLMPTKLLRIKANMLVRTAGEQRPFAPHVDMPTPHWVMIYYVNDSDGDTLILDKTYPDRENAAVLHRVTPKRGRAILFDGRHYHCGTCPAHHDTRVLFNYDFI